MGGSGGPAVPCLRRTSRGDRPRAGDRAEQGVQVVDPNPDDAASEASGPQFPREIARRCVETHTP